MKLKYTRAHKQFCFISTICLILFAFLVYFISLNPCSQETNDVSNRESKQYEYEETFGSLDDLYNCSDEQRLVNQTILMQTILFMIQETSELDPKLIEFVRSIIHKPNGKNQINLAQKNRTDFSQIGQSQFMDGQLNSKRDGFFIEAGGYNGEDHSVSR
jgi:hypothetical protein